MAKQPRILAGQTAAITGGARGIGRATAQAFLRQGMRVAIGDVDLQAAQQTAKEIGGGAVRSGAGARRDRARVVRGVPGWRRGAARPIGRARQQRRDHAARQVPRRGRPDGAADDRHQPPRCDLRDEAGARRMVPRDRGHIVNIASQAGKFGAPGGATYSATKHAVVGLTEAVRGELRLMGADIDLSYVMPYVVNTELGGGLGEARGQRNLEPSEVARRDRGSPPAWDRRSVGAEVRQAHPPDRHAAAAVARRGTRAGDESRPRAGRRRRHGAPRLRVARGPLGAGDCRRRPTQAQIPRARYVSHSAISRPISGP